MNSGEGLGAQLGEYRTKRLVLEAWEGLVAGESGGNGVG